MDPTVAAAPTGFVAWIMANGQVVAFIGQLAFWLVLAVASVWATFTFHRYVNFMIGAPKPAETPVAEETVSVEEFVE
jgi:hypothetical protein